MVPTAFLSIAFSETDPLNSHFRPLEIPARDREEPRKGYIAMSSEASLENHAPPKHLYQASALAALVLSS